MKLVDLFENANNIKWATGKHVDKGLSVHQHNINSGDFTMINVDIKKLFSKTIDMQQLNPDVADGGSNAKNFRIVNAKKFWEDGGYMDLAVISFDSHHKLIQFTDGRHRLVAAYQLGQKTAPVLAYNKNLDKLKGLLNM